MNSDELKAHMKGQSEPPSLAQMKLDYLRERGYEQIAVVMSRGEGDCAIVSNMGRVTWHGEATDQYIRGGSHD